MPNSGTLSRYLRNFLLRGLFVIVLGQGFMAGANTSRGQFPFSYRFQYLTADNGLPQNTVDDIHKDSRGFMWFATWNGLCRFDGYHFEVYRVNNSMPGLPNNFVRSLSEDRDGWLWIGTAEGLAIFDLNTETFVSWPEKNEKLRFLPVNQIYIDGDLIWIGSETKGLFVIQKMGDNDPVLLAEFNTQTCLMESNQVNVVYPLNKRELIVGTSLGAYLVDKESRELFFGPGFSNALKGSNVVSVFNDNNQYVWIGTWEGLFRFGIDLSLKEIYRHQSNNPKSLLHNRVNAITRDLEGNILFGTLGGLNLYNKSGNNFFSIQSSLGNVNKLNNEFINSLFCDEFGNVWIGTEKGGINKYNLYQKAFKALVSNPTLPHTLSSPTINSVLHYKNTLWVGTAGGGLNAVNLQDQKVLEYKTDPQNSSSLSGNFISSLINDDKGNIWIGTWGDGINCLRDNKPGRFERISSQNHAGMTNDFISSLAIDQRGFLLMGTEGGLYLYQFNNGEVNPVTTQNSMLPLKEIGCILHDSNRDYWIGTRKGLFVIPSKSLQPGKLNLAEHEYRIFIHDEQDTASIQGNYITTLREDRNGIIWMGTYGNGIIRAERKAGGGYLFTNFSQMEGLCNDVVYCIEITDEGMLWISTDKGLSMFDPASCRFKNYYERDGLLNNQFYWSASCKDLFGNLYFGGINGLNYFHPFEISDYPFSGKVKFTDLKVFNSSVKPLEKRHRILVLKEPISQAGEINLSYRDNVFSIEFSALDYFLPEKISYAYQLEGIDADWVEVDHSRRFASYTSLKGGQYLFKVRSTNSDGIWSKEVAQITINIKPPFWSTTWFRISVMVAIMLMVMAYVRFKTFSLVAQKKQLEEQVRERTWKIQQQSDDLINKNQMLENRQLQIEGQKSQLEQQNREISAQRDQLISLNKQVEEVNQYRIKFFTNISHEFRTPLMLIIDPIENLIEQLKENKKVLVTLNTIHRNANRLLGLINQLMYFRKIEIGKIYPKVKLDNLNQFIEDVFYSFNDLAEHRQIIYELQADIPAFETWFDKEKLEIILYNLLSNAFKFTPQEGAIQLKLNYYSLEKHDFYHIEIADNGIGIESSDLEHIFDRFFQSGGGTSNSINGSGIGLALTRDLTTILHGSIKAESFLQQGATFHLDLPCDRDSFTEDEIDPSENVFISDISNQVSQLKEELLSYNDDVFEIRNDLNEKRKPLVLIVEDNRDLRVLLYQNLEQDFRLIMANDGKEGLRLASKYTPDLTISDVMMPGMDGIELCRLLKSDIQTCHIPIIILTAKALTENWIEGLETGADDYIPKPFNMQVLKVRIRNLIENRKMMVKLFSGNLQPDAEMVTTSPLDREFLKRAFHILEDHYMDYDFTIEQFAGELCISKSLLYKKLKAISGMAISDFISKYRINKSLELLREGLLSISDIAYRVGFNDPKYFSRVFRKMMGMPPTEYTAHL